MTRDQIARAFAAVCQSTNRRDDFEPRDEFVYQLGCIETIELFRIELGITHEEIQAACTGVVHSPETPDGEMN